MMMTMMMVRAKTNQEEWRENGREMNDGKTDTSALGEERERERERRWRGRGCT